MLNVLFRQRAPGSAARFPALATLSPNARNGGGMLSLIFRALRARQRRFDCRFHSCWDFPSFRFVSRFEPCDQAYIWADRKISCGSVQRYDLDPIWILTDVELRQLAQLAGRLVNRVGA